MIYVLRCSDAPVSFSCRKNGNNRKTMDTNVKIKRRSRHIWTLKIERKSWGESEDDQSVTSSDRNKPEFEIMFNRNI